MAADRRSAWTLAAFAAPSLPLAGLGLPLVVYLPEFYANALGLNLAAVGTAFMVVRLLDIGFDPLVGAAMDRTRTGFGRFRPWFVASAPILMLASWMLFMAKPGVSAGYLWLWLLVVYAGFSIATLAQLGLGAALSSDYDQRSRIFAWWQVGNVVGVILALVLPPVLPMLGIRGHAAAMAAMGWFVIAGAPLAFALTAAAIREPTSAPPPARAGVAEYLALFRRPGVARLLAVDLAAGAGPAITGALFFFFFEHVKGFEKLQAGQLLLIYFLGGLIGAPLWTRLAFRIGKHRALAASAALYTVATLSAAFIPPGAFGIAAGLMALIGLPYAAPGFLLRAMMADLGDAERLAAGADRTGLLFALLSGTVKLASALAVGVTYVGLDLAGFDPKAAGDGGLAGLQLMFLGLPAALSLLAGLLVLGYPLDASEHARIRAELALRDAAQPPVQPQGETAHVRS